MADEDPFAKRCHATIVTTPGQPPIQCEEKAYHDGIHHGQDEASIYLWRVTSYPKGWQSPLDGRQQSVIRRQNN